jgi:hypothetical protein
LSRQRLLYDIRAKSRNRRTRAGRLLSDQA